MSVHQVKTDPHFTSLGQASTDALASTRKAMDARKAADPYAYWSRAIEMSGGRELTRQQMKELGISEGHPQSGFYRKRNKDGKDHAVAIWNDQMGMVALQDGEPVDPIDIWTFCARWPISHELYIAVADNGEPWPDDGPATIGDNSRNMPDDPNEAAKIEFEGEREMALEFLKNPIRTQEDADRAAVWSKRLSDLYNRVDKMFRAEKDPIVVKGREVDEKFRWREQPKTLATQLKRHQDDFLREQERLELDRQRKAREEEQRLQREAEEKARKVAAEANKISDEEREKLQREAEEAAAKAAAKAREAEAQKVSSGRTGARVSLRTFIDAEITNYPKLVEALRDRQEMKDLVQSLANRAAKAGVELPGMKIRTDRRAA